MKKSVVLRGSAIAFGAALLVSAGSAALAAETEQGESQGVDVEVQIDPIEGQGALAMTVAASSTSLEENGSTELERVFTGTLPTVTVTDTRAADEVPADAAWYVVGTASDFYDDVNDQTIAASHLGWSPQLVAGEGEGEAYVEVGGDVTPSDPGLVDQELLYLAESSEANAGGGVFSATANLDLVVPADVPAGTYSSTITLSLFE
ncbi:hypothetical protein GCM10010922_25780 [Microbacterium sorbitolivorans]|uniref:WxL domain-containing protein n=1 Tax=Microbacterium sorbitolivorans TaxID=1867410 RepID=A0A367Y569_9MICO|nr:hypothetical protein [Microbacterium sorbitolivorans]RCK60202.1 hypothetical protein DTO57_08780 [Microbacterium sorbitolivorans]GGF48761.1 hypothetical protein GCM10010922_25780 [Microbacterium sorbitolivorans]